MLTPVQILMIMMSQSSLRPHAAFATHGLRCLAPLPPLSAEPGMLKPVNAQRNIGLAALDALAETHFPLLFVGGE